MTIVSTKRSRLGLKGPGRAAALAAVAAASLVSAGQADSAPLSAELHVVDGSGERLSQGAPDSGPILRMPVESVRPASVPGTEADPVRIEPVASPQALSSEELRERVAQAERRYRENRFDEALALFREIVELDPTHAHAWLRVGNVLHRNREWFDALTAYRRAARPQSDPVIREKAVYNIALLNLELARQAIRRLERMRTDEPAAPVGQVRSGVTDGALRGLTDQLSVSYRSLSGARARTDGPGAEPPSTAAAMMPLPPGSAPAPEIDIRQGGLTR